MKIVERLPLEEIPQELQPEYLLGYLLELYLEFYEGFQEGKREEALRIARSCLEQGFERELVQVVCELSDDDLKMLQTQVAASLADNRQAVLTRRRESMAISTTDERISSVPSQSGRVKVMPSSSRESRALLSGSAQLRIPAFAPPIFCAPFR